MYNQNQLLNKIEQEINAIQYPSQAQDLFAPISYILSLGGKRIRPLLSLMGASLFCDDVDNVVKPAVGLEIFHNFTLLHDDLMDNADVRRNKPTVHVRWNPNTAILSGDAMQIMAYQYVAQTPLESLKPVLDLFSTTALEICQGQQFDMEFEDRESVSEDEYIEMIRLKTAVLLGCALKTGAIISGASAADADNLYDFGQYIGLAFQLKDDLLDVFGNPEVFGKKIGGDIINNKKTFLLINALNLADDQEKQSMMEWIRATDYDTQEKIRIFTELYIKTGAKTLCENKMEEYFHKGIEALKKVSVDDSKRQTLLDLATSLMYREK